MKDNVKQWAKTLSGCDGGNTDAAIWLCGIEWGGGSAGDYYKEELPKEIISGKPELDFTSKTVFDWTHSIGYNYGISFAKLYQAILGSDITEYRSVGDLSGKELFKLNLYPIAFDSTDPALWKKNNMQELIGVDTKQIFNTWCFFNRFPEYAQFRKEKRPKLIIGTGASYLTDFLAFFGAQGSLESIHYGKLQGQTERNKHERTYYWTVLDSETLLIVIPFFSGSRGLNSNYLLGEMGKVIRQLCVNKINFNPSGIDTHLDKNNIER